LSACGRIGGEILHFQWIVLQIIQLLAQRPKLRAARMPNILDDPDVKRCCMQVADPNGQPVLGIIIPFESMIDTGVNFFGHPLAGGDHTFTPTSFATTFRSSGIAFAGYVGMDSPTITSGSLTGIGATSPTDPNTGFTSQDALSATPYVYLIPAGEDTMRAPPLGDVFTRRTWAVEDQAIPLPFNIANSDFSTNRGFISSDSLSEPAFTVRKHQAFRAVPDGTNFSSSFGFTNSRLIGRSVWNTRWKLVIPGNTFFSDPDAARVIRKSSAPLPTQPSARATRRSITRSPCRWIRAPRHCFTASPRSVRCCPSPSASSLTTSPTCHCK
jgi:hypothetical protein